MRYLRRLLYIFRYGYQKNISSSVVSKNVILGKNHVFNNCIISGENISLGSYTAVADNSQILSKYKSISIGQRVSIGPNVLIQNYSHNLNYKITNNEAFINTYGREKFIEATKLTAKDILIEEDVWIGANCLIMPGVKIEKCAVIAANSLVNKNVGENEIWGGNPARFILKREFN